MTRPLRVAEPYEPGEEPGQARPAPAGVVRVRVPAKINLHLSVGPLRPDGRHELHTVYHAISLFDELTARASDSLRLTLDGEGLGELALDESNLVIRAARALAERAQVPANARLHLHKRIPLAAGLAGGSADAAAALVACDALWGLGLSREDLAGIAAGLGADVPFLLYGGTALGTGYGEQISPVLARGGSWHWVVGLAPDGLSTAEVYVELDRQRVAGTAPEPIGPPDALLAALRQGAPARGPRGAGSIAAEPLLRLASDTNGAAGGSSLRDPAVLGAALGNDLAPAALALRPALGPVLAAGETAGAVAGLVSGSGPTCVFLARDADHATAVAAQMDAAEVCRAVRTAHGPVPGARLI